MSLSFKRDSLDSQNTVSWWKDLQEDAGGRAGLKRCHDLTEVFFQPAFHNLRRRLGAGMDNGQAEGLAAIAALLSHVKSNQGKVISKQMANRDSDEKSGSEDKHPSGGKSPISEIRFRRILQCQTRAELFPLLLRVIRMLENKVNLPSLMEAVFYWNENTRRNWAIDYYSELPNTTTK